MISCNLQGRLGNLLFQIATTLSHAAKCNAECYFLEEAACTQIGEEKLERYKKTIFRNITFLSLNEFQKKLSQQMKVIREPINFDFVSLPLEDFLCLDGYFQTEDYFKEFSLELKNLLGCPPPLKRLLAEKYKTLIESSTTVGLHLRRGDYLQLKDFHTNLFEDTNYYERAMEYFGEDSHFLVFSDDIEWCQKNLKNKKITFMESTDEVSDLYLMSLLPNLIIANSSFSWWGAWLQQERTGNVIAPKEWFGMHNSHIKTHRLYPKGWMTV